FRHATPLTRLTASATAPDGSETSAFAQDWGLSYATHSVTKRRLTVHWRMAKQDGVSYFNVYAGNRKINPHRIDPHSESPYTFDRKWKRAGATFSVEMVLDTGLTLRV